MSEESSSVIEIDFPCVRCGYNLYGLPIIGTCPECGLSIFMNMSNILAEQSEKLAESVQEIHDERCRQVIERSGFSEDALSFIRDALDVATGMPLEHIGALQICRAVQTVNIEFATPDDMNPAERLGIRTGKDVARLVYAMVNVGLVEAAETDSIKDFDDIGEIADLKPL